MGRSFGVSYEAATDCGCPRRVTLAGSLIKTDGGFRVPHRLQAGITYRHHAHPNNGRAHGSTSVDR
jgi:hypothetical protein